MLQEERVSLSESKFVGRGEIRIRNILFKLFDCEIKQQVNIRDIVYAEDFDFLDQELQNHNFDLVMYPKHGRPVVVEVNYMHGEKISAKLRRIFVPLIRKRGYDYLEINNWDTTPKGIFWQNIKNTRSYRYGHHAVLNVEIKGKL